MITLLTGENSFEIERELEQTVAGFGGQAERIDGSEVELRQIPDLLMGSSLFADKRLVIIKNLSENKTVWNDFGDWLDRVSEDIHLVLVEAKPDKRTKTFKELQKLADVRIFAVWSERDVRPAEEWVAKQAKELEIDLTPRLVRQLVERTGVDQWRLFHALEKLSVLDKVTAETIEDIIDVSPAENIFLLFETALEGNSVKLHQMIKTFELTEEPYQIFGLLSGQAFQLAALSVAQKSGGEVAKDIAAHPFVLQKLAPHAKKIGRTGARKVIAAFADADQGMKTSAADPWLLIERALQKVAVI
ncbi:MAG: DNA polymerase III subunit delta [Candidatus Saccharibacteria bacterium]